MKHQFRTTAYPQTDPIKILMHHNRLLADWVARNEFDPTRIEQSDGVDGEVISTVWTEDAAPLEGAVAA